ncbi:MAG: hypothetical protein ACHQD8_00370 [Chitinophagales bacterium]
MKKMIIAVTIAAALFTASFANAQKAAKTTPEVKKEATMQKAETVAPKQHKALTKSAAAEKKSETKVKQKAK